MLQHLLLSPYMCSCCNACYYHQNTGTSPYKSDLKFAPNIVKLVKIWNGWGLNDKFQRVSRPGGFNRQFYGELTLLNANTNLLFTALL